MPPDDLRCRSFVHEGRTLWVVSFALPPAEEASLEALPTALREVAEAVIDGHDTGTIAARRGTSRRTVGKQLEQIFARLGVGSRRALVARFGHAAPGASPRSVAR